MLFLFERKKHMTLDSRRKTAAVQADAARNRHLDALTERQGSLLTTWLNWRSTCHKNGLPEPKATNNREKQ